MIDIKKLKQLIELMTENELSELDLREGEEQVSIKRGGAAPIVHMGPAQPMPAPIAAQPQAGSPQPQATPADEGFIEITSPMVGTFYTAPSPDADPFVSVGSSIDEQSVVCLIEAMKVFNEIKAEVKGKVERILVDNGQAVEFGQPLYLIKPQ